MDLIAESAKEEGGQHVHGWENIALIEEEASLAKKSCSMILFSSSNASCSMENQVNDLRLNQ